MTQLPPDGLTIHAEFKYTFEDFREALSNPTEHKRTAGRSAPGWLSWLIFVLLIAWWLGMRYLTRLPGRFVRPPITRLVDVTYLMIPHVSIAMFILGILMMIVLSVRRTRQSALAPKAGGITLAGLPFLFSVVLITGLNLYAANGSIRRQSTHLTIQQMLLLAYAPWAFTVTATILVFRWQAKSRHRRLWRDRPSYHRIKHLEIDATSFTMSDEAAQVRLLWPSLIRYRETPNLLLVYTEDTNLWIFPKRIFDEETLLRVKSIMHRNIPAGSFLNPPGAFRIVPTAPPLPLPVIPIESE